MITNSYRIAFAALDALWQRTRSESLGRLLSAMNPTTSGGSMDPATLNDWNSIVSQSSGQSQLDLIVALLRFDAGLYREVPNDLRQLIEALESGPTPERNIVESVIASWQDSEAPS
jgi:hypothetical protein